MKHTIVLVASVALSLGCQGKPKEAEPPESKVVEAKPAHCNVIDKLSICVEFASKAEAESECAPKYKGSLAEGICPAQGLSGSCAYKNVTRKYYRSGGSPQGPSVAKKHCEKAMKGTFTAAK